MIIIFYKAVNYHQHHKFPTDNLHFVWHVKWFTNLQKLPLQYEQLLQIVFFKRTDQLVKIFNFLFDSCIINNEYLYIV